MRGEGGVNQFHPRCCFIKSLYIYICVYVYIYVYIYQVTIREKYIF